MAFPYEHSKIKEMKEQYWIKRKSGDIYLDNKPSFKTFHYNELIVELHHEVYEVSEDTFQLLESIEVNEDDTALEIGTGCGLIALDCARQGAKVICTDINPYAIELVKRNYLRNQSMLKGTVEVRFGDLFSVLKSDERVDIAIFNPPYLPTISEERIGGTGWFDIATDGGVDGLSLTKRFIEEVGKYLSKQGRAYFVFSSLSDRGKLDAYLSNVELKSKVVSSRLFNDEQIDIYFMYF